jgi:hypothetical protein
MPAGKAKTQKAKVTVRDLGAEAKKGLDKAAMKKARGGVMMGADATKKPKPAPCEYAGEKCGTLHVSPRNYSSVLTVVIKTS